MPETPWKFTIVWSPKYHARKNSMNIQVLMDMFSSYSEGDRPLKQQFKHFTVMGGLERVTEGNEEYQIQSL